ncbi:MAG: phospho-sugar mutase [Spirochaetia bacterium]
MDNKELQKKAEEYIAKEQNGKFRKEVEELLKKQDWEELSERFYKELSFGTGGLRGIIGGGYNRMNPFVVQRATQGLSNYVLEHGDTKVLQAVIAYDSRRYSNLFAMEAAKVLAANGIKTYVFSQLRPTPELSYAVRQLNATVGIVLTASHNPPEYNGYKVYWSDGGQIVPPHDKGIITEVRNVTSNIKSMDEEEAKKDGMIQIIDKEIDDKYVQMIKDNTIRPELFSEYAKDLKVVYTPLHGTGGILIDRLFSELGIPCKMVPEQKEPDSEFPTVDFPNPEESSAMAMALDLAKKEKADLVIGTDPDSDRIGIAVPEHGEFRLITGNQLGALLADYVFSSKAEKGKLPQKPAFIKTIVTTELQRHIAQEYGAECYDVLTGFKYIAEKIREFEAMENGPSYVFGGEESYGFLNTTEVRDKDAISATVLTAEMALYHRSQGRTVIQQLNTIWDKYGYFEEILLSKYFKGISGAQTMKELMKDLRDNPPGELGQIPVSLKRDYLDGTTTDLALEKTKKNIELPSANVLQFVLKDGSIITARPSGTEPKIKFYASCRADTGVPLSQAKPQVEAKIQAIKEDIQALLPE